jgi:hypothetical protein
MGFIPLGKPFVLAQVLALVYLCVAGKAQGSYSIVMGL